MRVGASRPRQTSQGDDKDKCIYTEETLEDTKERRSEDSSQRNDEDINDEQGSG